MSSISETGHAKNVANLKTLISFAAGHGALYNPSNKNLKLAAIQALSVTANTPVRKVNDHLPTFKTTVAATEMAVQPLNTL